MDKRYLFIIIISIFCLISLYFISDNSDIVGSASANVGNYTFSIPQNMILLETNNNYVVLQNPKIGFYAAVHCLNSKSYDFNAVVNSIRNDSDNTILSNGTLNVNNVSVDTIYYSSKENGLVNNRSIFYFTKADCIFQIQLSRFNYDTDRNATIEFVSYVVDSMRLNYKI